MERYQNGLVALSADPITFGHLDLIRQAKERCESVVVLIANNDLKNGSYLFSLEERVAIAIQAVAYSGIDGVRVIGSGGLLVDTYLREGCDAVFRGIRNAKDIEYEEEQMRLHTFILPELEGRIVFLESREEYRIISSSLVKAFVRSHIDVSRFVPAFVKQLLEERICRQYKVAVTGCQANGKTFVAEALAKRLEGRGIQVHTISIDVLVRRLFEEDSPGAQSVREAIAELFGSLVLTGDRKGVDRAALKRAVFDPTNDPEKREKLHRLTEPHVARLYREALSGKQGLVIVEWAQLAEMGLSHWTNHQAIVVAAADAEAFAAARLISPEERERVSQFQWSTEQKVEALYRAADEAKHGTVVQFVNRIGDEASLERLAGQMLELFPDLKGFERRKP